MKRPTVTPAPSTSCSSPIPCRGCCLSLAWWSCTPARHCTVHCPHSFCLALRTSAGYKLAYTGDTRPFQPFRNICAWGGALDLLIHEATLEHLLISDAIIKKNSSITEAIQDGRSMGGSSPYSHTFLRGILKVEVRWNGTIIFHICSL